LVVLGAVLIFGWFTLLASEYKQLGSETLAGTLFISNLLSWRGAGYFDTNADLKPLLHLWSLGVEGQFYLIWPLVLLLLRRRGNKIFMLIGSVAFLSFVINIISVQSDHVASFYSPLSRFFEFMAGAAIAYVGQQHAKLTEVISIRKFEACVSNNIMSTVGVIAILSGLWLIDSSRQFPGFWVLLPTLGTMMLILAGPQAWINRYVLSLCPLVWVGLISYPLYLWHLPILSFARVISGHVPSREVRFLCVLLAVGLAWATFRFVELPIRSLSYYHRFKSLGRTALSLILPMVAISVAAGVLHWRNGFPERLPTLAGIEQVAFLASEESKRRSPFSLCDVDIPTSARCARSKAPETEKLLVIGDSHSGALASGLYQAIQEVRPSVSVVLQTEGGCSPLRGMESKNQAGTSRNCHGKYESVYQWAIADPSVKTVVIVSRWAERVGIAVGFGYVNGNQNSGQYSFLENGRELKNNSESFVRALHHTFYSLYSNGKRVVFVHQVPEFGFFPPFCGSRPIPLNVWQKEDKDRCSIARGLVDKRQEEYRQLFESVKVNFPDLLIMDPVPIFCNEARCSMKKDLTYFYRDDNHLNNLGAYYFGKKIVAELY
jgi:peptidoglycan/LPS O-acetylase OafA/YrhL